MAQDIKQKIVLDGEKEYKQALKDAQRELKTLKSELKAETAELGKNATEQDKQTVKIRNLQKQIAEQEKIVRTYTKALAEVKEKYGDNQDEIAKWEIKLNDARTTLANMKSGLEDAGQGFQKMAGDAQMSAVAANSVAQAFEGMSDIGDSVSGAVEDIFSGVLDVMKDTVGEIWGMITETAAKADNWSDIAGYYGSTAAEVQAWDKAIKDANGSFEDFIGILNLLEFKGKDKGVTGWLGISDVNYTDQIKYAAVVMGELAKKREELGAAKFNDQFAEVFGGKASQYLEIISKWDDVVGKKKELGDKGYLLSEDEIETMAGVHNELGKIENRFDALKDKFAIGFGSTTLDIETHVSGALDAIAKYFDADSPDERDAALKELEANITGAFEAAGRALQEGMKMLDQVAENLKMSENPVVRTLGEILGGITDALKWLTEDNAHNAVAALEVLAGFWLVGKGAKMAGTIAKMAYNIKAIEAFKGIGSAAGAAGGAAGAAGGTAGAAGAAGTAAGSVASAAAAPLFVALSSGALWFGLGEAARQREWGEFEENEQRNAANGETPEILEALSRAARQDEDFDWEQLFRENANEFMKLSPDSDLWGKIAAVADISDGLQSGEIEDILSHMLEYGIFGEDFTDMMKDLYNVVSEKYQNGDDVDIPADWWKKGSDENGVTSADIQNLNELPAAVKTAMRELLNSIVIKMDSEVVARILTPKVSAAVAAEID